MSIVGDISGSFGFVCGACEEADSTSLRASAAKLNTSFSASELAVQLRRDSEFVALKIHPQEHYERNQHALDHPWTHKLLLSPPTESLM